ncbi:MAG: UDP-N-acetylglucosamine 1-carboxyvinyltransferase [Eubacteriales bacterium]|nr:UDP-N-acetylglucosamine 1-carboxyvinyltransferase [Eubacteriales bacterium]
MSKFIINGGKKLVGEVNISGAKNATLGIIAAAIMTDEDVILDNIPDVEDVNIMLSAIEEMGGEVKRITRNKVHIFAKNANATMANAKNLSRIRASYYFVGALLSKKKQAVVRMPGGCSIGERPIDLHLKGFKSLGAECEVKDGFIIAKADKLTSDNIYIDIVSVGATINLILASVMAEGTTVLENVAKEPHVVDVANFLNSMGANVKGAGTDTIRIKGVPYLHGTTYTIIPDQIEAGTYMTIACATEGDIIIKNIIPKHLDSISAKLIDMGNNVVEYDEAIRVIGCERQFPTTIKTLPYPGFPTDMQPQITVLLSIANGESNVTESIFEDRFKYIVDLKKMGAQIEQRSTSLNIKGIEHLKPASLMSPDLRAGAALVIAALMTKGESTVDRIEYIKRGYENIFGKLKELGADIREEN